MERLLTFFTPHHYQLDLEVNRTAETISGTVQITGAAHANPIKLHAHELQITSVSLSATHQLTQTCDFTYDGEIVTITLPDQFAVSDPSTPKTTSESSAEPLTLSLRFTAPLRHDMQGCYLSTYQHQGTTRRLATTQFESHYARDTFPCVDEPAAKATFDLTLRVPDLTADDLVIANTPLAHRDDQTFTFATTPKMSTYLLAWVIGPLHGISTQNAHGTEVASYCALNQPLSSLEFANTTAARALEYFEDTFGIPYPLPKLDQVALPDFEAGAMENWGLITFRESMMLADQTATLDTKHSVALTVTHELSHQWFGDLVTMAWWDDLWLNESFASVIEYFATDALYPEFNIWQDFFTGDCLAALKRDCLPGVQAVHQAVHSPAEISTLFDGAIVYAKGARLILMLIRLLGEPQFFRGVQDYFEQYQYQNTSGDDLWRSLQPYADFDVREFMTAWISQPGYPMLERAADAPTSDSADAPIPDGTDASVLADGLAPDAAWSQHRFLITGETDDTTWPLPAVKTDLSGHYLIKLSDQELHQRLADFSQLTDEERLRLLIDRELLAKTPAVASVSLFDLIDRFADSDSAAVWEILALIIADLKLFCPYHTSAADHYKSYLRDRLAAQFDALDLGPLSDPAALVRRDLMLSVAYYSEYQPTLRRLADLYQPDFTALDAELRAHILAAKFYFDEDEVFAEWLGRYPHTADPELKFDILYTLVDLARQPAHLDRLLELLEQPDIVRAQDHLFLYVHLLRNPDTRDRALDWLLTHWGYVERLTGDKSIEDYPRYAASLIRTPEEAQRFYAFFDLKTDHPTLARTIKVAHTDIDTRLRLIATDAPAVQEYLAAFQR